MYIPQEVLNKIKDKSITRNIFRIQSNAFIMRGFCCIIFIEYMLAEKSLLDYINLFSQGDYKKNKKVITISTSRKNMSILEFKLKKIDETRNCLLEEIEQNDLMSEKHQRTCKYLNYVEPLLILASKITGCVSISAFASLVCVPVGNASSAVEMKICKITTGIKKYK